MKGASRIPTPLPAAHTPKQRTRGKTPIQINDTPVQITSPPIALSMITPSKKAKK
ncbi:uncharacterized protein K444DRAFT_617329 [Hyaloscypha bicolor E]|uniref:Uncharacterized protein n=1 Tax=Hyaloscypha bicolor E TaxID=1095630 RepID=A0A2J6SVT4_9HELO|nr:uncharacterized protein K444DRAFT_617329 [Hyaloscypha bicolor E]PMD54867.1 hypothetical protein K444DRAFT_617329 [Hyaloscypha bicolor E]